MKKITAIAVCILLLISLLPVSAFAVTASAKLTGPDTVRAGDTITLTFKLSGSGIFGASGTLSYDTNQLELKETKQKVGSAWVVEFNGNIFVVYDNEMSNPINKETALFTVTFKVKSNVATGTNIKVSCTDVIASDGNADSEIGTVTYSKTIAAPASKDNTLKSLTVGNATISPAFSSGTTSYTAEVPFEVSKLDVQAQANDSKAKVSINNPNLTPGGTTNVTVTVTAENGSTKTYTIAVKRAQDPNYVASGNNDLSGITVEGFLLSPVFSAENTSYVIWLPYETQSVAVSGTAADALASVRVEGGADLIAGADNEIKVICTAEDGTEKVYTVIAKRAAAHGEEPDPTDPPTEPTEPETEPSTEPATDPSEPETTDPVQTQPTGGEEQPASGGVSAPVVAVLAVLGIGIGFGLGFILGKKKT